MKMPLRIRAMRNTWMADTWRSIITIQRMLNQDLELSKEKLNELKTQKKGLMQILLTGQVRVEV